MGGRQNDLLKSNLKAWVGCGLVLVWFTALGQSDPPAPAYHLYVGNTHSHTVYTWSHGEQFDNPGKAADKKKKKAPGLYRTPEGVQYASSNNIVRADWQKHQGPPSAHFARAKANGFDFYATTDHSQESAFAPTSATNAAWLATQREATAATDASFVAIAGYEHSENNGPGGTGHLNVLNSAQYLNALSPGIDLPYLYHWLETATPNGEGPVVACFNHPGAQQYNDWDYRDAQITDIITLLEVINSGKSVHYAGFVRALDKGWKVSPVSGGDNHGFYGITHHTARTFVLATSKTKAAILEAMKNRRTYASFDKNLECRYTVNGAVMGSTLDRPEVFQFDIAISGPDTNAPNEKITKVDIVKDGGAVVQTYEPTPAFSVRWRPSLQDSTNRYFFVRVWNAGDGHAPGADPDRPVAWLAPVWTGR